MNNKQHSRLQAGVSLLEALVALAVMAFGMLGMVGMQATLRSNSDVSKQRAEAVRLGQARMEQWRSFEQLEVTPDVLSFADIVHTVASPETGDNATFTVRSDVAPGGADPETSPKYKTVAVNVAWTDRADQRHSINLVSTIAGIAPGLAGGLGLPSDRSATQSPRGRHGSVPAGAKALDGTGTGTGARTGTSVFMPPQPPGGKVAWVFNNITGLITGVCTVPEGSTTESLVAEDVASCSNNTSAQLLSGYVRFARTDGGALTAAESENPTGVPLDLDVILTLTSTHPQPPVCFDDAPQSVAGSVVPGAAVPGAAVTYFCAIFSNSENKWAGRSRIRPIGGWSIGTEPGMYKVCRYTPLNSDEGTRNTDHPLDYVAPSGTRKSTSLTNQNFLVISSLHTCPTDSPTAGDFINSNTRLHQDGSSIYNNGP